MKFLNSRERHHPAMARFETAERYIKEMSDITSTDRTLRLQKLKELEQKFFSGKAEKEHEENILQQLDELTFPEYSHVTEKVSQDIREQQVSLDLLKTDLASLSGESKTEENIDQVKELMEKHRHKLGTKLGLSPSQRDNYTRMLDTAGNKLIDCFNKKKDALKCRQEFDKFLEVIKMIVR
jgi:hypothetical protein